MDSLPKYKTVTTISLHLSRSLKYWLVTEFAIVAFILMWIVTHANLANTLFALILALTSYHVGRYMALLQIEHLLREANAGVEVNTIHD